jgi:chromosome segregation ATPase
MALGAQLSNTSTSPVEERILDLYLTYFTKGGKLRSGKFAPPLLRMQEELDQAQRLRKELFDRLQQYEDGSRRVEDIRSRRAQLTVEMEALHKTINGLKSQSDAYRLLKIKVETCKEETKTADARYLQLKQAVELIREKEKAKDRARTQLKRLEEDLVAKTREISQRRTAADTAKEALRAVSKGEEDIRRAEVDARDAEEYLKVIQNRESLEKEIGRITDINQQLEATRQSRLKIVAPDSATLKKIQRTLRRRDQAAVRIDSSLINLEIEPLQEMIINTITGKPKGEKKAPIKAIINIAGSPEVAVELKNVARLRATGPTGEIQNLRADFEAAGLKLKELTRPYGTMNVEQLEDMAAKAAELDRKVQDLAQSLNLLLNDRNLTDIKIQLHEEKALEAGYLQSHPEWAHNPPDFNNLMRVVSNLRETHGINISEAHEYYTNNQAGLASANEQEKALTTRIDDIHKQLRRLDREWAGLTTDGLKMSEREAALENMLMVRDKARNRLMSLERKLGEYTDNPLMALDKLERQLNGVREETLKARDDEMTAIGVLETLAAEGPYSAFTAADEKVNQLSEAIQREEMRVEAIQLLYETVNQCRREAVSAVTGPVEMGASRLLQRISGRRLRRVKVSDRFEPNQIQPDSMDAGVDLDNLSGGETEQLYLATRLALAEVLSSKMRQLVVMDDVLTATDAGRLARVISVLEEKAQLMQILILTCHPERYRGLADTQFYDLETIQRAAELA